MTRSALLPTRQENAAPVVDPYDRASMTHRLARPTADGKRLRYLRRPVARTYDEAEMNGSDYYHVGASPKDPQGTLRNSNGGVIGFRRTAGWFLYGRKWQDDPEHVHAGGDPVDVEEYDDDYEPPVSADE